MTLPNYTVVWSGIGPIPRPVLASGDGTEWRQKDCHMSKRLDGFNVGETGRVGRTKARPKVNRPCGCGRRITTAGGQKCWTCYKRIREAKERGEI